MSNSVIGYNFGAVGTTGDTGGFGPNGKLGPAGPTGATGGIGPTGASVSEVIIGDFNEDGSLDIKTIYTNGASQVSSNVEGEGSGGGGGGPGGVGGGGAGDASLGPVGDFVYKLFVEDIGTAGATALVKGIIDNCYIGTMDLKTIKGTGGIVVTQNEDEIFVGYRDNKQIVGVTPAKKNQIAFMSGTAGNSAEATPLVRGATGFNYRPETNSINAICRKYREVGFRFGITEVSGGSINDSTRIIEFNVDPGLHLGTRYVREDQYGPSGPWGNTWYIDVDQVYTSQVPLTPTPLGVSAPFVKINDVTATADTFETYFGNNRATAFTLAIKGGSSKPRIDGKTCGVVWPENWIFPYKQNPVLTPGLDVYQFYSLGKKDNKQRTVWYGVSLKSSSGTDIFFPTY